MLTTSRSVAVLCWLLPSLALAFNDPVDQIGNVTARIVGPIEISHRDQPFEVKIVIDNQESHAIDGSVRLGLIDGWTSGPSPELRFAAPSKSAVSVLFQVHPADDSYSAHYPVHAWVKFTSKGMEQLAHPILVVETKFLHQAVTAKQFEWRPFPLTTNRKLALLQLPLRRAVIGVEGEPVTVTPVSWLGVADGNRCSIQIQRGQRLNDIARDVLAIHPPWFEGRVGTAWVEYPLELPAGATIRLRGATAVTPTGDGDGVTFRIRVADLGAPADAAGNIVFERHSAAKNWEPFEVDLRPFAGRQVRLQFESHPGPKKNTAFDQSYWAEPTLVLEGPENRETPLVTAPSIGTRIFGANGNEPVSVELGHRGLLDAKIQFQVGNRQLAFRGFQARVMGLQLEDPGAPVTLREVTTKSVAAGLVSVRHRFESPLGPFDLVGDVDGSGSLLRVHFRLEQAPPATPWFAPHIEELATGAFSEVAERVYAGHGNVLTKPEAFRLGFDGHRLATSHVGFDFANGVSLVQAVNLPPESLQVDPGNRHYALHVAHDATLTFLAATDVWEAAREYRDRNGLRAASGVANLAGRFVFDLWGGEYASSRESLRRAMRYGLTDSAVVWHNWQRWGYDYRLPEIFPPNPKLGTEESLRGMIDDCRQAGVLFALHDNYIDFYPDATGFSYRQEIAFHGDGRPVRAWNNESRGAQSYRYRAERVANYLRPNLEQIRTRLAPSAYFVDVWPSAQPYDYWTATGQFYSLVSTRDVWREQFAAMRTLLGNDAPQISESGHDQLIGWLDGAQTNHLRVGRPIAGDYAWSVWDIRCEDAERTPWFDFAHHDRFALHGAGYSVRYEAGLDRRLHGIYSDDYLATEMLTGHPTMVSEPFGRDVVRKYWLTRDVMRALALKRIEAVEFAGQNLHRQHVRWSGGGEIWVNRGEDDWQLADRNQTLPSYGFLARIPTPQGLVTASVTRRAGQIVETASAPHQLFVNGRALVHRGPRIRPTVAAVQATGPRGVSLDLTWIADDPIPDGYQPFLHLVDSRGEIATQAAYDLAAFLRSKTGRITMRASAQIPENLRPGDTLQLRVGMYAPRERGNRLLLQGDEDGDRRIRLGTLELVGTGDRVTSVRWQPWEAEKDLYHARHNPQSTPIDFGPVKTAGGVRVAHDQHGVVVVTPLPDAGNVAIPVEILWERLPWKLPRPTIVEARSEAGKVLATTPIPADGPIVLQGESQVFEYRLGG